MNEFSKIILIVFGAIMLMVGVSAGWLLRGVKSDSDTRQLNTELGDARKRITELEDAGNRIDQLNRQLTESNSQLYTDLTSATITIRNAKEIVGRLSEQSVGSIETLRTVIDQLKALRAVFADK